MTWDLTGVESALRSTHADGYTALYDAAYIVLRQFHQDRLAFADVRRQAIVLLSDGIDTASHVTFDDVLELVHRAEVTIYVISLADASSLPRDSVVDRRSVESAYDLSTLARESGGRLFTPRGVRELSSRKIDSWMCIEMKRPRDDPLRPAVALESAWRVVDPLFPNAGERETSLGV
jgi:hypothetical protein